MLNTCIKTVPVSHLWLLIITYTILPVFSQLYKAVLPVKGIQDISFTIVIKLQGFLGLVRSVCGRLYHKFDSFLFIGSADFDCKGSLCVGTEPLHYCDLVLEMFDPCC